MKKIKMLAMVCSLSLLLCGFSTTAYAKGGDDVVEPLSTTTTEETVIEPAPLTPEGNLTLVDDIDGEQANSKQFVTVQSKAGNYFYLIIDRDGEKENVYFLNLVDEADLLALIEEPPVEPTPEPTLSPVEEEPPVVEEKPKEKRNGMGILALFLILGVAGGAFYYFKVLKPKQNNKGNTNLDEYDFDDEDDEELILDELSEDEFEDEDTKDN